MSKLLERLTTVLLLFLCTTGYHYGQNLVKNPSLEIYDGRIIDGWQIVAATPDIASRNNEIPPRNLFMNPFNAAPENPRKLSFLPFGNICFCQWFDLLGSEVMQVELLEPLKRKKQYLVSLYIIRKTISEPPIHEVSVSFSRRPLIPAEYPFNYRIPYLSLHTSTKEAISDPNKWVRVKGIYEATGGERFLSIGNFYGANRGVLEISKPVPGDIKGKYYCYDNVSVYPLELAHLDEQTDFVEEITEISVVPSKETITLEDAGFAFGQYQLLESSLATLDKLADYLTRETSLKVTISGHTDNIGSMEDNLQLSLNRAKAVMNYLLSKGISVERMNVKSFGEAQPKDSNQTEQGRQKNRRVEIELIEPNN
jgi:outer membrane protein OmpA-like peptidoglycan-associated protein